MRTHLVSFFCIFLFVFSGTVFAGGKSDTAADLVIYAYDSWAADWGPGPGLIKRFEAATGYKVRLISCGDAAQVLSRAVLEKKNPGSDILVGIDNNQIEAARRAGVLRPYKPANASLVSRELVMDEDWLLTPYDWGFFAMIHDTASGVKKPESLEDLLKPEYKKKIILMDPRTSTPGAGFLAWTIAVYGDAYPEYWSALKPNILTLAPGWDTGYGLFTAGEAPLVISYTTSPPYHVEYDNTTRFQALIFEEGHIMQIEGMGITANAGHPEAAEAFIEFMLTDEAQSLIPQTQWMYPVSKTVELPSSFDAAPAARTILSVSFEEVRLAVDKVISILAER